MAIIFLPQSVNDKELETHGYVITNGDKTVIRLWWDDQKEKKKLH